MLSKFSTKTKFSTLNISRVLFVICNTTSCIEIKEIYAFQCDVDILWIFCDDPVVNKIKIEHWNIGAEGRPVLEIVYSPSLAHAYKQFHCDTDQAPVGFARPIWLRNNGDPIQTI